MRLKCVLSQHKRHRKVNRQGADGHRLRPNRIPGGWRLIRWGWTPESRKPKRHKKTNNKQSCESRRATVDQHGGRVCRLPERDASVLWKSRYRRKEGLAEKFTPPVISELPYLKIPLFKQHLHRHPSCTLTGTCRLFFWEISEYPTPGSQIRKKTKPKERGWFKPADVFKKIKKKEKFTS